jgi:hypothetical protein
MMPRRSSVPPTYHSADIFCEPCEDEGATLCAAEIDSQRELGHGFVLGSKTVTSAMRDRVRKEIGRPQAKVALGCVERERKKEEESWGMDDSCRRNARLKVGSKS